MARKESFPGRKTGVRSGGLGYIGRLRPFLSLDDFKLNLVALLQALVALGGDRAVVDEHIRTIVAAEETVPFALLNHLTVPFKRSTCVSLLLLQIPPKGANFKVLQNVPPL